jgi:hypothetical protein
LMSRRNPSGLACLPASPWCLPPFSPSPVSAPLPGSAYIRRELAHNGEAAAWRSVFGVNRSALAAMQRGSAFVLQRHAGVSRALEASRASHAILKAGLIVAQAWRRGCWTRNCASHR